MTNAIKGSAKAWVNFVGSSGSINASYNVSSVTRNSTGNYTVTFTSAMVDANYVTSLNYAQYQYNLPSLNSQSSSSVTVVTANQFSSSTSLIDPTFVVVSVIR